MKKLPFQQRYRGTKWNLICGVLCLLAMLARLLVHYINQYSILPGVANVIISLLLLFCGYRFFREYYCYMRLSREQLIISRIFKDRKINLPDIDQMSLDANKNIIYLLLDDGTEYKINLLDLNETSREDFRKAFYVKQGLKKS